MSSLNKVMLIGHLGKNPELRYSQIGNPVCTMIIATDESYTDREGTKIEKTEWHRVVVWGKSAENCNRYLRKGSLAFVEGSLTTRKWMDQKGVERYTTEIKALRVQFLDSIKDDQQGQKREGYQNGYRHQQQRSAADYAYPNNGSEGAAMDDVPF